MGPERFDDVAFEVVEDPSPPPRRPNRKRRAALSLIAAAAVAGGVAGAASATDEPAAPAATTHAPQVSHTRSGVPMVRGGPECHAGKGHRHRGAAAPRY
jgi:hypothetical protein